MNKARLLIFVICYNTEKFIEKVLERIPDSVLNHDRFEVELLIIDDQSADETFATAVKYTRQWNASFPITILRNPRNLGYGGIQKVGYHYAIKHNFDAVLLLHGDGQYPPEMIADMVLPILDGETDAMLGSRMIKKANALKGGMPLYKWVGNQILTRMQNVILGSDLAEFHTGFRAYSVPFLKSVPFEYNSNYYDFDTDILIQLFDTKHKVREIPIPTYYGEQISYLNGIRYGFLVLKTSMHSRLVPRGIFYHPKFDYQEDNSFYTIKVGFPSSHEFALARVEPDTTVLDVGCGPGYMARALSQKSVKVISVDKYIQPETKEYSYKTVEADLDNARFTVEDTGHVDTILLLDIIEHLKKPERLLNQLREDYAPLNPTVVITTGNIAFFITRFMLLLGQFNYGKRGILDLDHTRLFTFQYLRKVLLQCGYDVVEEKGIPGPFPLAIGDNWLGRFMVSVNGLLIRLSKSLFSYQIAVVARPRLTVDHLLHNAQQAAEERLATMEKA